MAQVLQEDKIGALSFAGDIITLQPSTLTLGGQQYSTDTLVLDTAGSYGGFNTLHFLYVKLVAGTPTLDYNHTLVPSTFKLVEPTAKLVGAFYSTGGALGAATVGSFVTIEGPPKTYNAFDAGVMKIETSVAPFTWNKGPISKDITTIERDGGFAKLRISFQSGAGSQAPGDNVWLPPDNFAIDTVEYDPSFSAFGNATSSGYTTSSGVGKSGSFHPTFSRGGGWGFIFDNPSGSNNTSSFATQTNGISFTCGGLIHYPVVGWDSTPLKDL